MASAQTAPEEKRQAKIISIMAKPRLSQKTSWIFLEAVIVTSFLLYLGVNLSLLSMLNGKVTRIKTLKLSFSEQIL